MPLPPEPQSDSAITVEEVGVNKIHLIEIDKRPEHTRHMPDLRAEQNPVPASQDVLVSELQLAWFIQRLHPRFGHRTHRREYQLPLTAITQVPHQLLIEPVLRGGATDV
jgi:hypothetical protein